MTIKVCSNRKYTGKVKVGLLRSLKNNKIQGHGGPDRKATYFNEENSELYFLLITDMTNIYNYQFSLFATKNEYE